MQANIKSAAQQRTFPAFRAGFNTERSHGAGGRRLAARYEPYSRPYPDRLPPLEYPGHFLVKRLTNAGTIRFQHQLFFLANALQQHPVRLEETDDGLWSLYLGSVLLGKIDERETKVYG